MWDSDPGQTGIAPPVSCADLARCADIIYGTTGTAPLDLIHDGARYYARSTFRTTSGNWTDWASWDWFEVQTLLTFSITSGPASNLGTLLPGNDATGTSTMTINTNNATGWSLSASGPSNTDGMTGPVAIARWTAAPGAPTLWPSGTGFGISLLTSTAGKDTTHWGTGTDPTQTGTVKWIGPQLTTPAPLANRQTYSAATDTATTGYRVAIPAGQAPGTYSTTITYTAVANP